MPGMNSAPGDALLIAAFRSALLHQLLISAAIFLVLLAAWAALRARAGGERSMHAGESDPAAAAAPEPPARQLLRLGFGALWLVDGILQAQPQMPSGLADQVIKPAAASLPDWVRPLAGWGVNLWDYHPVTAAASVVWIQVGIGLWMILSVRGLSSRLAALSGIAWGLVVWVFGEAFGGIFAPGLSVLFGAPGAALLYAIAGAVLALPDKVWKGPWPGRALLGLTGAFFLGLALVQAWPGNGFWHGTVNGQPGPVAAMAGDMAGTPQPRPLAAVVAGFGTFAQSHGFAVNLVSVVVLAAGGAVLCASAARPASHRRGSLLARIRPARLAVAVLAAWCLADWVLIQDLGVFGGLGTDPNSMLPLILLFAAGYLGMAAAPAPAAALAVAPAPAAPADEAADPLPAPKMTRSGPRWGGKLGRAFAGTSAYAVASLGAVGVIIVGAAPMALATTGRTADPIIAQAIAGPSGSIDEAAAGFSLTSQDGRQVTLSSLRGKAVLLTFLDPVCTTDCPLIAQEMRSADQLLGARASETELVAVVANPAYLSTAYTQAFTRQEHLGTVPNWLYLTGSLSQLETVWNHYGIQVESLPAGAMAAHDDLAFVISPGGEVQTEIEDDPGPGTSASMSSFAGLMASSVLRSLGSTGETG
jgi:cytochrome oxidase Cu insertion factor (SCO1/SenC/PrrC family)